MKVTFYYIKEGLPKLDNKSVWNEDIFVKWDAEITEEQYKSFIKNKEAYVNDFDEIQFQYDVQDSYEEYPKHYSDYLRLNCRTLYRSQPEWCKQVNEKFVGDMNLDCDSDIFEVKLEETEKRSFLGCLIHDEDYIDSLLEKLYKEKGVCVNLRYCIDYQDDYQESEWIHVIKYEEYKKYMNYVHENHLAKLSYYSMEKVLPKVCKEILSKIVKEETAAFKKNLDPDDWDDDEWKHFKKRSWKITDDFPLGFTYASLGFDHFYFTMSFYKEYYSTLK